MSDTAVPPELPLAGLRVLETACGIAGPYAGKLLCDAGAEVVKLEPREGDPLRFFTACEAELDADEDSALFRFLNASKRSLAVGRKTAEDDAARARAFALAREADIVIEDTRGGQLTDFGLTREALHEENPRLVFLTISPWGLEGPHADRPANAFTFEAQCGSSPRRMFPDRTPVTSGGRIGEFTAGIYGAAGALAAWVSAKQTGAGQTVDVSLYEAVITVLTTFFGFRGQWIEGPMAQAAEAPSIERASDGWVGLSTHTGQQWKDFCGLIERPDLAEIERFYHASERFKARDELREAFWAWTGKRTVDEVVELASLLRVPSAPVYDAEGVLACEHYRERGVFVESPHGFRQPRAPYQLGDGDVRAIGRAPSLGEHDAEGSPWPEREGSAHPEPSAEPNARPLAGLRVIDMTAFWAGPAATTFLADLGADVIKIESIQRPDGMRFIGATGNQPLWEWSEVFAGVNCGKRSITLNLDSEDGRDVLLRLLADADILVENASPRVLENFGLGFETLHAHNEELIVLRMPAWGLDGPWRDRPGFAANIEQASGIAAATGYADEPLAPNASDPIGGMHAAFALLLALERRKQTGSGQLVEASLIEPALNVAAPAIVEFEAYGSRLERSPARAPHAAPQGFYRCQPPEDERSSEWLAVSVETDAQWRALCEALGDPAWCQAPELQTLAGRRRAHDEIDRELGAWCAEKPPREAEAALLVAGVPAALARNAHYLLPDPQLDARRFFQPLDHPITGTTLYPNLPMRFSAWGAGLKTSPPPTLGQHNDSVLGEELGLPEERITALRESKVIGERPDF